MPPQQPLQPQQSPLGQHPVVENPYDFIMSPQQPKKTASVKGPQGVLFIVGAAAVIIILLVVVISMLRGSGGDTTTFIKLAQQQQEIVRVATLDYSQLSQQSTKNFSINVQLGIATDQASLTGLLGRNHIKVSPKQLTLGTDSTTDTQLQNAISTSTLDTTLTQVLHNELTSYQQTLRQAYNQTAAPDARQLLNQLNTNAQLLIAQSQQ